LWRPTSPGRRDARGRQATPRRRLLHGRRDDGQRSHHWRGGRAPEEPDGQEVIRPLADSISETGGLAILRGNLAPDGLRGQARRLHAPLAPGPARVFESEEDAFKAVSKREIKPGDVVVIRNEGPAGGPGMREMLGVTAALVGEGLGEESRYSRRRFSGATRGLMAGPRCPGGPARRPIAALRDGDIVEFDVAARELRVELSDDEIRERVAAYESPPPKFTSGVLGKYAKHVGSAAEGARRAESGSRGPRTAAQAAASSDSLCDAGHSSARNSISSA